VARCEHAVQVLEAMQADDVGIAPNRKTFNLLLTALWAGEQFPLAVAMYERALQVCVCDNTLTHTHTPPPELVTHFHLWSHL
jgi:hypothetical protein